MQGTIWHLGQAAILGLVQGLTEFLPVSSSGHLVIVREFLRLPDAGNGFDAILHLATLVATLIYFRQDWWKMLAGGKSKKDAILGQAPNWRLLGLILLATIPGLLVGYFGNNWIEHRFRSLLVVAILLVVTGLVYLVMEKWMKLPKKPKELTSWDALNIGLAQAIAVIPGISRSGATLLGGIYVGLTREAAAKFSFLLAAPVIAAAGGYGLYQNIVHHSLSRDYLFLVIAFIASLISGLVVIRWLLKFYQKHSLHSFAYYLLILGVGLIIYSFWK